jgi:hypothetical protein
MNAFPKLFGSRAASPLPAYDRAMVPGTRVRFSGKFLANTGQRKGGEGGKCWTVQACDCALCASGDFVCTDELGLVDLYTAAEISAQPSLVWRHIAKGNLSIIGKPTHRDDP